MPVCRWEDSTETDHQVKQQRIERTLELISKGRSVGDVRRTLKAEFKISRRTADRYQSRAREELLEEPGTTIQQQRAEAVAWSKGILSDSGAPLKFRMQAREQLNKRMGLHVYGERAGNMEANRESNRRANSFDDLLEDMGVRNGRMH